MGSTSETESKDSASSSDDECDHAQLAHHRDVNGRFECQDCTQWVECPHTSWRWTTELKTRKICNWCGHQWADPEKQQAAMIAAQELEYINANAGGKQFTSVGEFKAYQKAMTDFATADCLHLAWSRVGSPASASNGWSQRRQCDDCGCQWTTLVAAATVSADECKHVAWNARAYWRSPDSRSGKREKRTCLDCGYQWITDSDPTPAQDEIDADEDIHFVSPEAKTEFLKTISDEELPQPAALEQTVLLAVEYSIGHATRTILVAPDTTVVAIDGDLRISHTGPIHGIVAIRPTYVSQPAGEEQST
jgi:hypothetical protein